MFPRTLAILSGLMALFGCASDRLTSQDMKPLESLPSGATSVQQAAPTQTPGMDADAIQNFFETQTKGAWIAIETRDGAIEQGAFSSYDDYYQTAWIIPAGSAHFFRGKAIRLAAIRGVHLAPAPISP